MKLPFVLFTAAIMFFASSCGNSSETTSTTADTTTLANSSTGEQATTTQDTATSDNGLMKPMNDMMTKMQSMEMTGDFDIDFANMMIEHHQSALDMAQVEVSQGKDETMKSKAREIITKQKKEQQELKDFVQSYKASGMKHGEDEMQKSMSAVMNKMKSMEMTGDVDRDFATMMTSHHQDGISMAKMELKNGMSDKLKQMAQKIVDDQQKEIMEFKIWLSSHK